MQVKYERSFVFFVFFNILVLLTVNKENIVEIMNVVNPITQQMRITQMHTRHIESLLPPFKPRHDRAKQQQQQQLVMHYFTDPQFHNYSLSLSLKEPYNVAEMARKIIISPKKTSNLNPAAQGLFEKRERLENYFTKN